jgi:alkylation response protein AidB-like acyl-CoA dehydrogenase
MPALLLEDVIHRAEQVVELVALPSSDAVDRECRWPADSVRALQRELGGLVVPEDKSGMGHGLLALARVCEALGRACPSCALCFGMHCVGAAVLAAKATPDQVERYLEPISRGEHLTTLALSEPGTGAHFYLPQARLDPVSPEEFRVTGTKTFVTNGSHADSYVMSTTAADPEAPPGMFSCVVVREGAPGLTWGPPWTGVGMRGNDARTATLENVPVPRADLLGEEGDQIWYVFNVIAPFFLVAMSGTYLGIAAAALEEARRHLASRRYVLGARIGEQPVLQHRLGALWAQVERTRRLVYYAATQGDSGGTDALPALLSAKAEVADCAVGVANEAMTLGGGIAYRESSRLERLLRDARASHVMAPTTDILRTWTGRALLDLPILGD